MAMADSQNTGIEYGTVDAAQRIGVSAVTLRRWVKAGRVKPTRILPSGRYRWSQEDIDAIGRES